MTHAIFLLAVAGAPPDIDLWTMGPGEHVYERFGHAALRVRSPGSDRLYNFGVSDFNRPGFFADFLRGRSVFWLDVEPSEQSLSAYRYRDRSVYAQPLLLDADRLEWLARRLRHDALPANRNYAYHHFSDNCSTRIRDLLDEASRGKLATLRDARTDQTLRAATRQGLAGLPGLLLAVEFLGRPMDARPDRWERMFHPDALREEVARSGIAGATVTLHRRRGPSPLDGDTQGGRRILWVTAAVVAGALYLGARRGGFSARAAMAASGVLSAAIAVPIDFVALFSRQDEFRMNESLLVFWPTDLVLLAGSRPAVRAYLRMRAGIALLLVLYRAGGLLVQDNAPLLALGAALLVALDVGLPRRAPVEDAA